MRISRFDCVREVPRFGRNI